MTRRKPSAASRNAEIVVLDEPIRENAPNLAPFEIRGIRAYGRWHCRYTSGPEGEWFHVGLARDKQYISLCVCPSNGRGDIADQHRARLLKADIGGSCVRFNALAAVDPDRFRDATPAVSAQDLFQPLA